MYLWHRKDIMNGLRESHEMMSLTMYTIGSCLRTLNALTGDTSSFLLRRSYWLWACGRLLDVDMGDQFSPVVHHHTADTDRNTPFCHESCVFHSHLGYGHRWSCASMIFNMFSYMSTHKSVNFSCDLKHALCQDSSTVGLCYTGVHDLLAGFIGLW